MSDRRPVVVDAWAFAEFLLGTDCGERVATFLVQATEVHAPHLLVTEVASVIRGWVLGGHLDTHRALASVADLATFPLVLERALLPVIWRRHNLSAYDAACATLVDTLGWPLVTTNARLATALAEPRLPSGTGHPLRAAAFHLGRAERSPDR